MPRQLSACPNDDVDMSVAGERHTDPRSAAPTTGLTPEHVRECFRYLSRLTAGDRHLAEELTQQVCESASIAVERTGKDVSVGWMIVAARRRFADHLRRTYRDRRRFEQLTVAAIVHDEPDWDAIAGGEALECLGRLAEDHRAALVFRYVDDLTTAQVAQLLGRSTAATDSLLARARRELARHVTEVRHG